MSKHDVQSLLEEALCVTEPPLPESVRAYARVKRSRRSNKATDAAVARAVRAMTPDVRAYARRLRVFAEYGRRESTRDVAVLRAALNRAAGALRMLNAERTAAGLEPVPLDCGCSDRACNVTTQAVMDVLRGRKAERPRFAEAAARLDREVRAAADRLEAAPPVPDAVRILKGDRDAAKDLVAHLKELACAECVGAQRIAVGKLMDAQSK